MVVVHIAQYLLICQRHLNKIMNLLNTMMLNIHFFRSVVVYSKKKANVPMSTSTYCLCLHTIPSIGITLQRILFFS